MSATLVRLLVAGALAAALGAPSSAATWGPPVPLSNAVAMTEGLQLVAGSDGRVLAVWTYRLGNGVWGGAALHGAGSNLRPRVVVAALGSPAGFGAPRRLSPLPPAPPYGHSLGPKLSATSVRAAAGGHGTVVAVARDPRLDASAAGKVLVVWGARPAQGPARVLVSRAAIAAPGAPFTTRVLERSAPLDLSTPQATDQFGPATRAAFAGEVPIAAWQTVIDGRSAVRTAYLEGQPMTATFTGDASTHAILDDLVVAPTGAGALAWSTVDRFGTASPGFVAISSAGGPFGEAQELPAAGGAYGIRLAYEPQGLLAAWNARDHLANAVVAAELR